jgi:hypothetical protein
LVISNHAVRGSVTPPQVSENHFRALAATDDVKKALAILDRLDADDSSAA